MSNRDYELDIMTRTILGEAAGEDAYGQAMVGNVIMNRSRDSRWGGSVADVSLAPKQFSAWNSGAGGNNPNKWDANSEAYKRTRRIAEGIYDGTIEDRTGGATHYYSPAGMKALDQGYDVPKWAEAENARREDGALTYGGHIFTGKAEGAALSVSTKSEPPKPKIPNPWLPIQSTTLPPVEAESEPAMAGPSRPPIVPVRRNAPGAVLQTQGSGPTGMIDPALYDMGAIGRRYTQEEVVAQNAVPPALASQAPAVAPQGQQPMPNDQLRNMALHGIGQAGPQPGDKEDWYFDGTASGGSGGGSGGNTSASTSNGYLSPELAATDPAKEKGWLTKDRSQMLLAIGSGLLSGDDWASGIGAAAENLMGVNEGFANRDIQANERAQDIDLRQKERAEDRAFELEQTEARKATAATYGSPIQVKGRDPATGQEVVRAGSFRDGQYFVPGPNGQDVLATSVMQDVQLAGRTESQNVTSGAGGIPNADSVNADGMPSFTFKRGDEAKNFGYAIRAVGASQDIDAMFATMTPDQVGSVTSNFQRWAAQNSGEAISTGVINSLINESGLQGAAAATMSAYLQAVLRSDTGAAYTGLEFSNYGATFLPTTSSNPEELAQKKLLRDRELQRFAASTGAAAPYIGGLIDGTYTLPGGNWAPQGEGALDSSNVGDPNKPDDWSDAEWAELTDEEKASLK